VHTPVGARALPVLVWIHGGGFTLGSANEFDGTALAVTANAVVVTVNYRLGLFGWLDVSEVGAEYEDSGDVWLTDQIQALHWVRDNISAFGGDAASVTIIGESAGAASVIALCGTERTRGLFHRAVASSPPHFTNEARPDLLARIARKRRTTRDRARAWVMTAPVEELVALGMTGASPLTSTGPVYRRPATEEIAARGAAAPPLLVGFTSHEGDFFLSGMTSWRFRGPLGWMLIALAARSMQVTCAGGAAAVPDYLRRLRRHYRVRGRGTLEVLFQDVFRRASITAALATTQAGGRGYLYELDVPCRFNGVAMRSAHMADVELTFNAFNDAQAWLPFSFVDFPEATKLAEQWVSMLATFARHGDPAGPLGEWPAYDASERASILVTPDGGHLQKDRDGEHRRGVWAEPHPALLSPLA